MDKIIILERIKEHYGYSKDAEFAAFLGIKPQVLSNWKSRNTYNPELLYTKCEEISPAWLLTGKGSMLLDENDKTEVYRLRTDTTIVNQEVPLYEMEAAAGIVSMYDDLNNQDPVDYISIPNLPKCDGALPITGDSMYPLLKSGDIVMYKKIEDLQNDIFFGEMYLVNVEVAGDDMVMVKYVQRSEKGDQYLKLVSYNPNHQPKDISLKKVRGLALIKASIRINSMQ